MDEIRMVGCRSVQVNQLVPHGLEGRTPVGTWHAQTNQRGHDLKVARLHRNFVLLVQRNADDLRCAWLFHINLP